METKYNCYNEAIKYLKAKYGFVQSGRYEIIKDIPEDDHDGKEIMLLVNDYYYGYSVRKELYDKLIAVGATL